MGQRTSGHCLLCPILPSSCRGKGHLPGAETLFHEALANYTQTYGPVPSSTLRSNWRLSELPRKYAEAVAELKRSLSQSRDQLGHSHSTNITVQCWLALCQYYCEKSSDAESTFSDLLQRPMELIQRLDSYSQFAAVLKALRNYPEAEKMCWRAFKGRQTVLGTDRADTLFTPWSLRD